MDAWAITLLCGSASEHHGDRLRLLQMVCELLERWLGKVSRLPQIGGQETIGGPQGLEGRLREIPLGARVPARAREDIRDTCEVHNLLHRRGANDTTASRRWNEPNANRAAFAMHLHG